MRSALAFALSILVACGPSGGGDGDGDGGATGTPVSIAIEPANPIVLSVNGNANPVDFTVRATYADDRTEVVSGTWTFDSTLLGAIGRDDGRFSASGVAAGVGNVNVAVGELTAATTVTVRIEDEHIGPGVPTNPGTRFDTPQTGAGAPLLLYPLDKAVMPKNVKPPHLQWEVGEFNDIFRVTLTAGLATVTAYLIHDGVNFTFDWPVETGSWRALKNSAGSDPITMIVDRWNNADGNTYRSAEVAVNIADANLDGAIYYWDLARGKMLRITEDGREDFMPNPPASPSNGSRCIACHTVSRDGKFMAAELWGGNQPSAIFDLTQDLSVDPAPTVVAPGTYTALFSTFNPDASRLLINVATRLELIDSSNGATVATTGLPTNGAAHPSWSPDGTKIAYVANVDGTWAVDFTVGDLAILPVTGPTTFGPPQIIRPADGMANSWPSWTPDSRWVAFARGTNSRARRDDIPAVYPGKLWMVGNNGGQPVALDNANGGADDCHLPNFSPFDAGGYFWLAFYTTRDYGNDKVGTKGTGRRQIWVTAVSNNPQAGQDPSNVAYWLPDQDSTSDNMSAYWAMRPPVD